MVESVLFLACLMPVLGVGAIMVELLLRDAPRRGKRPDLGAARPHRLPPYGFQVCAVAPDGRRWIGSPVRVARDLGLRVRSHEDALGHLERLVRQGVLVACVADSAASHCAGVNHAAAESRRSAP